MKDPVNDRPSRQRPEPTRVILATSNGTGMGHLARQNAVALALLAAGGSGSTSRTIEPIVFSLSQAVHVVAQHGLRAEYCPSHHRNWMPHLAWHRYLGRRLSALLEETRARALVFDGVSPYFGMLRIRRAHPDVAFVWVRRGMWRPGANKRALVGREFFDLIIEPGDFASDADAGATSRLQDATRIPPVTVLEQVPALPRAEAADALGLDPNRPTALVTLGAGSLNDTTTPAMAAIQAFLATGDWQVAVTRAPLALSRVSAHDLERVHELVGVYPLARYLSAFDAAVGAAGYNTVHELLPARVPTLLVPNSATATDDQNARANFLAAKGYALCADDESPEAVARGVGRLLDPTVRTELSYTCESLPEASGASAAAELVLDLVSDFQPHTPSSAERLRQLDLVVRMAAMRALGTTGTAAVRRMLGRTPAMGPTRPLSVRPYVTEDLDPEVLKGDRPVEHLLPQSSAAYRLCRLEIAYDSYRWPVDEAS